MHIQTLTRADELPPADVEDIFELLGVLGQHRADLIDQRDLVVACGMGTVFFTVREKAPPSRIVALARMHVVHTGSHLEAMVTRIEVPSSRRRKGIGIALVKAMMTHAHNERMSRVFLLHPLNDSEADRVFREHGFVGDSARSLYVLHRHQEGGRRSSNV